MSEVEGTRHVVEGLAQAREAFLTLARWLESQPRVNQVASGMDTRFYGGVAFWECFVEAELDTGNAVCWWIDLHEADGQWVIEPSVFIQHGEGQDGLDERQPQTIRTDREFRTLLNEVVAELIRFPERTLERAPWLVSLDVCEWTAATSIRHWPRGEDDERDHPQLRGWCSRGCPDRTKVVWWERRVSDGRSPPSLPWQGLLPVREALRQSVLDCPDALTRPFAHGAARKDELGHPYGWFQFRDSERRGYLPVPVEEGMSPCFMAGSLVIAHGKPKKGMFPSYRLVLNGPKRGRVWRDDRSGSGSVGPCESASRGVAEAGFREWVLQWLEDCRLAQQFAL